MELVDTFVDLNKLQDFHHFCLTEIGLINPFLLSATRGVGVSCVDKLQDRKHLLTQGLHSVPSFGYYKNSYSLLGLTTLRSKHTKSKQVLDS